MQQRYPKLKRKGCKNDRESCPSRKIDTEASPRRGGVPVMEPAFLLTMDKRVGKLKLKHYPGLEWHCADRVFGVCSKTGMRIVLSL